MKEVNSEKFWKTIDGIVGAPLGSRTVIDINLREEGTFTEVTVYGHNVGKEISCHRTGRTRCYLAEEVCDGG